MSDRLASSLRTSSRVSSSTRSVAGPRSVSRSPGRRTSIMPEHVLVVDGVEERLAGRLRRVGAAGRAVTGEAGDGERPGGDDGHGADGGPDDLALGATGRVRCRLDGRDDRRRRVTDGRDGRRRWAERAARWGAGSRPVGGVARCRRCSRSLLGAAARPEPTDGVGGCPGDRAGTGPRSRQPAYPAETCASQSLVPTD